MLNSTKKLAQNAELERFIFNSIKMRFEKPGTSETKKRSKRVFFSERKYSNLFKKGSSHFCQIQQLVAKDKQFEIEKMKKMIKSVSTRFRKTFFSFFLFVCFKSNKMKQT